MKGMIERSESKVSLCYSQGLGASQPSIRKRDVVISAYGVFVDDQANGGWFLLFVLSEHLHSFSEVKCLQGYSKTLWINI